MMVSELCPDDRSLRGRATNLVIDRGLLLLGRVGLLGRHDGRLLYNLSKHSIW
jgi:hypothetical protein